jgi:hypothetical protein
MPSAFYPPVPVDQHGFLASVLLLVGLAAAAAFFANPVSTSKPAGNAMRISVELVIAAIASIFLGFGSLFLMLWAGVFV